jgi:hypothetical protein
LLPPTNGWVTLTGKKAGAPRMNFIWCVLSNKVLQLMSDFSPLVN